MFLALCGAGSFVPARADDQALSAAANQAYLADNAQKPGVIIRPDGLQYRILRSGVGNRPSPTATVQVNYSGRLINGAVVDGTSPGLSATLHVGTLLKGLSEALQLMHEGDHWQIVIPPNLAFGSRGTDNGVVPPNQALVFDVTLVSIAPAARPQADTSDQMSISGYNREQGTVREQGAILNIPQ